MTTAPIQDHCDAVLYAIAASVYQRPRSLIIMSDLEIDRVQDYRLRRKLLQVSQRIDRVASNGYYRLVPIGVCKDLHRGKLSRSSKGWRRHVRREKAGHGR